MSTFNGFPLALATDNNASSSYMYSGSLGSCVDIVLGFEYINIQRYTNLGRVIFSGAEFFSFPMGDMRGGKSWSAIGPAAGTKLT
ncbi:hypothetical protein LIER_40179 [Lithospermum erythrorhizon]|uniref:Uncharacterized protein n=1 Tax=Lithospermum erythrorhizon TaxID=34254 RepID=A0AAV3QUR5_LITER